MRPLDRFELEKLKEELYDIKVKEDRIKYEVKVLLPDLIKRRDAINKKIMSQYSTKEEISA